MTEEVDYLEKLQDCIVNMDKEGVARLVQELIDRKVELNKALDAMTRGMHIVGEKYARKEYFIPEVLLAAEAMNTGIKLIEPHLKIKEANVTGVIVIGTVMGDIHSIGKNLVALMLKTSGFIVHNLGEDVPPEKFVKKIQETNANIVCMSALMTTTRNAMKQTIEAIKKAGLRDKVKVVIGGGAVSAKFAKLIGADAYGRDAYEAVEIVKKLVGLS